MSVTSLRDFSEYAPLTLEKRAVSASRSVICEKTTNLE